MSFLVRQRISKSEKKGNEGSICSSSLCSNCDRRRKWKLIDEQHFTIEKNEDEQQQIDEQRGIHIDWPNNDEDQNRSTNLFAIQSFVERKSFLPAITKNNSIRWTRLITHRTSSGGARILSSGGLSPPDFFLGALKSQNLRFLKKSGGLKQIPGGLSPPSPPLAPPLRTSNVKTNEIIPIDTLRRLMFIRTTQFSIGSIRISIIFQTMQSEVNTNVCSPTKKLISPHWSTVKTMPRECGVHQRVHWNEDTRILVQLLRQKDKSVRQSVDVYSNSNSHQMESSSSSSSSHWSMHFHI